MSDQIPVHDELAERAAIGAMILDAPKVASYAQGVLKITPESFYVSANRTICRGIFELLKAQQYVDLTTLMSWLRREGVLDDIGGQPYIAQIIDDTVSPAGGPAALEIVRAASIQREIQRVCSGIVYDCYTPRGPEEVDAFAAKCATEVGEAVAPKESDVPNVELLAQIQREWDQAKKWRSGDPNARPAMGLELPWPWLNDILCGLEDGTMTVIGGRPSAGKTSVEDCIVDHVCRTNPERTVLRWTMDSSGAKSLLRRMLCRHARVSMPKMKRGYASYEQLAAVEAARAEVGKYRMRFHRGCDLYEGLAWIRSMCMQYDVALVTIDYVQQIQLMHERGFRAENENSRLTVISSALKEAAQSLNKPFLVLSQLSRDIEKEDRQEERLSDFRGSGAIEQDADKAMFVGINRRKRDEMDAANQGATIHKRPVAFNVVKQKDGEIGWKAMWMYPAYFMFVEARRPECRYGTKIVRGKEVPIRYTEAWPDDALSLRDGEAVVDEFDEESAGAPTVDESENESGGELAQAGMDL